MDGSPDFRPELARRASDPSLEEMLRRARDAHLGDATDNNGLGLAAFERPPDWRGSRLWGWLLFAAGLLAGVLLSVCVVTVAATVSRWTAQLAPATPMATVTAIPAAPTSTPTPFPTVTPTTDEIISLVQDFYDNQGPYASNYVLLDVTDLQIQSQDGTELTACISYESASVNAPDTVAFYNTRLFTLAVNSDGNWQVVQMGESGSCTLS